MDGFRIGRAAGMLAAVFALTAGPADTWAQSCPPELAQAKAALERATASAQAQPPRTLAGARQDIQAPRGQDIQAPRGQDIQAPRGQDIQAPRGQDIQAPRGQDIQAPRGQDIQAPRGEDIQAPRTMVGARTAADTATAAALISESEAACKAGNMTLSTQKANAALEVLR